MNIRFLLHEYLAHFPQEYLNAQAKIIELLKQNVRSDGWDFSLNIEQAKKQNHPNIPLLQALADVISNKAELDTLKPFLQETETTATE